MHPLSFDQALHEFPDTRMAQSKQPSTKFPAAGKFSPPAVTQTTFAPNRFLYPIKVRLHPISSRPTTPSEAREAQPQGVRSALCR